MLSFVRRQQMKRKGQAMAEYAILLACIAVACVLGAAVLGHKAADQYGALAVIMPGAHAEDNNAIRSAGALIPFDVDADGVIVLDVNALVAGNDRYAAIFGTGGGEIILPD